MGIDRDDNIEERELRALELHFYEGKTKKAAYMATHDCTLKSAESNCTAFFKRAIAKLSDKQLLEYYNLGRERFFTELNKHLEAKEELVFRGFRTKDKRADNPTRAAALKLLAQINCIGDTKRAEDDAPEGVGAIHIIIDN